MFIMRHGSLFRVGDLEGTAGSQGPLDNDKIRGLAARQYARRDNVRHGHCRVLGFSLQSQWLFFSSHRLQLYF